MKVKKFNLGFVKVEHHKEDARPKQSFIKIEKVKKPEIGSSFTPNIESSLEIKVMPKNLYDMIKKEKPIKPKPEKQKVFSKIFGEINFLFANIIIFYALLNSISLFLLSYLFVMLFSIDFWYSFIIPSIYLMVYLFFKIREKKYIKVEKKFPKLNEKLRTAADNINLENPVVEELKYEVSRDIKDADYASFFNDKKTSYSILLIILLCFSIIFLAKYNVEFKLDFVKDKILGFIGAGGGNTTGLISDIISATQTGTDEDIYGEEQLAKLGSDKLTISINKVGYEINVNDVKQPQQQEFENSPFPPDARLEKAEVYNKRLPKEDQELVKNYFKNMAQG